MYSENRRLQGGSGFADAMFRFNASSEDYAEALAERVIRKEWGEDSPYRYHRSERFFIIARDEEPIIIRDYSFVEKLRCEDVHGFENWVLLIVRKTE